MREIEVAERRSRLARRHHVAPGHRVDSVVAAARSVVCLHGTDPASVFLSAVARVDDMKVTDLERALYAERSLVKHLAMRRTVFVFPRETLPVAQAGASNRVADSERRKLIRDVEKAGLHRHAECWLSEASERVLASLSDGREATSSELREEIPLLAGSIVYGEGKTWGGAVPVGPRVLTTLSAAGRIVRASNHGGWTTSRPRWASVMSWLGEAIDPVEPWPALLPPLDPTAMGWFERGWYLGPYQAQLFDTTGNAGPTAWWDGRIVGGWRQSGSGEVVLQLLEDVGAEGLRALEHEAVRLSTWLDGTRVPPRFPSPLSKVAAGMG